MRRTRLLAAFVVVLAAAAPARGALQWYQLYEEGLEAADRGAWEEALAAFAAAARTRPEPAERVRTYGARFLFDYDPAYHQARCLVALGRPEEAGELLARAEAGGVTEATALAALRERLAALQARPAEPATTAAAPPPARDPPAPRPDRRPEEPGVLVVISTPPGAAVAVDGRPVGTTPLDGLEVTPGSHGVEIRLPGREPWVQRIESRPGERLRLDVTLGPAAPAAADGRRKEPAPERPETESRIPPAASPLVASADDDRPAPTRSIGPDEPPAGEGAPAAGPVTPPAPGARPAGAPPGAAPRRRSVPPLAAAVAGVTVVLVLVGGALARRRRRRGRARAGTTGALPNRIGPYRVEAELGRGGMATTYRAIRGRDGLVVAVKIPHETGDPTYLPRFLREGRLGETLHHPRIVRIVEAGEADGRPFLALELIPGRTLRRALDEAEGPLPVREALAVARDVAEALDYAHGKGVVHRDLKPENVMLLPDGTVKVMDFGVARVEGQPGLTTSRFFFGSPVYAAPELVDPATVDHRADLYSLGVVLFELLEGRPPFHHESVFKLLEMHQRQPLPAPEALPRPLPDEVWALLRRLLAKEPADRHAGAQELLVELKRLLYELPGEAGAGDGARRSQSHHRRHGSTGS